jgi:hypothetical protein
MSYPKAIALPRSPKTTSRPAHQPHPQRHFRIAHKKMRVASLSIVIFIKQLRGIFISHTQKLHSFVAYCITRQSNSHTSTLNTNLHGAHSTVRNTHSNVSKTPSEWDIGAMEEKAWGSSYIIEMALVFIWTACTPNICRLHKASKPDRPRCRLGASSAPNKCGAE